MNKINKYTTLPVLIYYLKEKRIPLLSPDNWEDKNDIGTIKEYMEKNKYPNLLVSCFSVGSENIHLWNAFASGSAGCCIEIDRVRMEEILGKLSDVKYGIVEYRLIKKAEKIDKEKLAFTKRLLYEVEKEYRIIYVGGDPEYDVIITHDVITKITFSQKMPNPVYNSIAKVINDMTDNSIKINRSTVYENDRWLKAVKLKE